MEGGPSGFKQGFTCPALLGILLGPIRISRTGLSPSLAVLSRTFRYPSRSHIGVPQPHEVELALTSWFGLFPFRSPLLRESLALSFPRGTEMFHFPRYRPGVLCIQTPVSRHDSGWVSPFGDLRIKACLPLPGAYRSLLRPSSPADAKASTMRPFELDQNLLVFPPFFPPLARRVVRGSN